MTLDDVLAHRHEILRLAREHEFRAVTVIGSVARGTASESSDLDLLVDPLPTATLLSLGAFEARLEELLGVGVTALSARALDPNRDRSFLMGAVEL
ncbi:MULTISPECIES: nucleotidyltransferase family protein [unclassified Microcella]|uniref:nucleotidyltransferase family protein n=1 Tax=unclassified Microcella TaxID=2630066 RepID=UPI0006F2BEE6|nr:MULTISPECIES: nucleotidyltransferase domain-containing protein [unclassified Microcella]KQV24830.1 hypothetical protein ASC54_10045 [Yonghaparkia sp. Root332]KRF31115.1 hypothetical protein ASG83_09855 [Yonghaparkia sp. Soil809]